MLYRESLPPECPPDAAEEIKSERSVYRLVRTAPAGMDDFRSQRAEKPDAVFRGVTECQACGLSVFAERSDCESLLKLRHLRGRCIAKMSLTTGAGKLQQTFQPSHHTWWPLADFDILGHSNVEKA
jgi:hypothetical protein